MLEVENDRLRCKDDPQKWVLSNKDHASEKSLSPHAPSFTPLGPDHQDLGIVPNSPEIQTTETDDLTSNGPSAAEDSGIDVAHSKLWKWVDVPSFIPKGFPASTPSGQELQTGA